MTIRWLSRHDLSPAQLRAIRDLHGEAAEVVKEPVVFTTTEGLADYIREHVGDFVYAVAGAPHYLHAALSGCRFGVFENHPQKRQDGMFGLAAVYHVIPEPLAGHSGIGGHIAKVWSNPDPTSDQGEVLIPVNR